MVSREKTNIAQPVAQLPVADVEQAQAYYQKVLGFEIAWIYPDKTIGAVSRGEAVIFFAKTSDLITPNIHWIFAPDIDLTYQELQESGAEITEEIENKPWGLRQFAIKDLNGHLFYFHCEAG